MGLFLLPAPWHLILLDFLSDYFAPNVVDEFPEASLSEEINIFLLSAEDRGDHPCRSPARSCSSYNRKYEFASLPVVRSYISKTVVLSESRSNSFQLKSQGQQWKKGLPQLSNSSQNLGPNVTAILTRHISRPLYPTRVALLSSAGTQRIITYHTLLYDHCLAFTYIWCEGRALLHKPSLTSTT